jgi:predicted RNA-binding protein with PIN domain
MPYLIDGNNLMGSWGGPTTNDDRRSEVVRRVAAFCRSKNVRATLVFDGHPLRADMAVQDLGPLTLRVPPSGSDADTVIRELLDRSTRPAEWVVVTSDKAVYSYAKTCGASVLRAHEWNALERRSTGGAGAAAGREKPEREEDVEGWLKTFGGQ